MKKKIQMEEDMPVEKIFVFGGLILAGMFIVAGWTLELRKTPEERAIESCGDVCRVEGMGIYTLHSDGTSTCECQSE
jgi:hypothetical protein